jgi:DNA-binding protein YbaB
MTGNEDGGVRVELDATGRVCDVFLDEQVMHWSPAALSEALTAAFQDAQDRARQAAVAEYGGLPSQGRLRSALEESTAAAERQFTELSTALYDLSRRAERAW